MMYGVAVCGWTVGVYILQLLWENVQTIFVNYNSFVMGYICIVGLISFIGMFIECKLLQNDDFK